LPEKAIAGIEPGGAGSARKSLRDSARPGERSKDGCGGPLHRKLFDDVLGAGNLSESFVHYRDAGICHRCRQSMGVGKVCGKG